jgi:hypothetical protein
MIAAAINVNPRCDPDEGETAVGARCSSVPAAAASRSIWR